MVSFSGISCSDGLLYELYTTGINNPILFTTYYSTATTVYYTVVTLSSEGTGLGIEVDTSTGYVGCPVPLPTTYYYVAQSCGVLGTSTVATTISDLSATSFSVKDQNGDCWFNFSPTLIPGSLNVQSTYESCFDCNNNNGAQGYYFSGGYDDVNLACQSIRPGGLYVHYGLTSPVVGNRVFLDSNCTKPLNGYDLFYCTNWGGSNGNVVQIDNMGYVTQIIPCTCTFAGILSDNKLTFTSTTETCLANMEFIVQYNMTGGTCPGFTSFPTSRAPNGAYHKCNCAVFELTANGISLGYAYLSNSSESTDMYNYPPGENANTYLPYSNDNRYNSFTLTTPEAQALAATTNTTGGYITFGLNCALLPIYGGSAPDCSFGAVKFCGKTSGAPAGGTSTQGNCHTSVAWVVVKLNGTQIYSGCPNGNILTINPCTGQILNNYKCNG